MGLETLAALTLTEVLAGASIAATAIGGVMQAQAASVEGESAQNIANYNAQVAEQDAKAVEQRTALEQRREAQAAARRQSTLEARLGAEAVVSTAGAPLLMQAKQASESELQNLMVGYEGATQAARLRSQAAGIRAGGKLARQRGRARATGALIGAGTSVITGFAAGREKLPRIDNSDFIL